MERRRLAFEGYKLGELIHDGKKSLVYRARRVRDGSPLILKTLRGDPPSAVDVASLRRQHEIARDIAIPGAVSTVDYEELDGRPVLLMEDTGGISLARKIDGNPLEVGAFFDVAVALAEALAEFHARGILHRDINPTNIIVEPDSDQVKLCDFGLAVRLPVDAVSHKLVGTPLYIAPEQTGRLDRKVDQRSDLYSLGATLYELLTGAPPFSAADPMELIHKHITRTPAPPHLTNPEVPPIVSALVLKLLAKEASDRYQTARGLAADLRVLRDRRRTTSSSEGPAGLPLEDFALGRNDRFGELRIPQRLYGRDDERQVLGDALQRVRRGAREQLLVVGPAGVGKSALVREVFSPLAREHGSFVSGKFEQYRRNVPYAPLVDALRQLVEGVLAVPEAELQRWRDRLGEALGSGARLLCEAMPQLELIIGEQPVLDELPPAEARNRFHLALLRFIGAFGGADRPVVLFLDDLQWADAGSLDVVKLLLSAPDISHLLLVGSCRVPVPPHVGMTIDEIAAAAERPQQRIELAPLQRQNVRRLVADALRCEPEHARDLADLVHDKTAGNPFFVTQFLHSLHQEGLLTVDEALGVWRWDLAQIGRMAITDNVVELMERKINRLPQQLRDLLMSAACVGATFDLATLSLVTDDAPQRIEQLLRPAVDAGLVLPLGEPDAFATPAVTEASFRFLHDRVHQAAYSLLSDEQRKQRHLIIGRLLLARDRDEPKRVFDIVHQLDDALELITDAEERVQLARLNLAAGNRARASSAHRDALRYLEVGIDLLPPACWTEEHALAFDLHLACAECAFFAGDHQRAHELFALLHTHSPSRLQKAELYICQLMLYDAGGEYGTNREIGLEALAMVGCAGLDDVSQDAVAAGIQRFMGLLADRSIEGLVDLPEMTDPERRATMALLVNMTAPAFITDQQLFALIILEMVNMSLEHGVCEMSPFAFGALGILFNALLEQPEQAHALGQLSLALQARFGYAPLQCKVEFLMGCFILPWSRPLDESLSMLRRAHLTGIEHGDLVYAAYAVAIRLRYLYTAGRPMHEIDAESEAFDHFLARIPGDYLSTANVMTSHMRRAWAGQTESPTRLGSDAFDEAAHIARMERDRLGLDLFIYRSYRIQLALAYGDFREAYEQSLAHGDQVIHQAGMFDQLPYWLSRALAASALATVARGEEREQLCADLATVAERIERWAGSAPDNFTGYLLLLRAEGQRLAGDSWQAAGLLGEAAAWARDNGSFWLEAAANELAGRLFLAKGLPIPARAHLLAARRAYQTWGASAMVDKIDRGFPQLPSLVSVENKAGSASSTTTSTSTEQHAGSLDLLSVVKASEVIAREIVLDKLLARLLDIAVENAGAQTGALLLEQRGQLVVEATRTASTDRTEGSTTTARRSIERCEQVCAPVVHYVYRSQESLALDDARSDPRFGEDPTLQRRGVRSVLCTPLVAQGKLSGILYLENNLQCGVFTAERLEILRLLSAQMASALENARLYRGIEAEVVERTKELRDKNEQLQSTLSELQSAQARLLQSKKMADLGWLAAGVTHEVNSPLGVLASSADVIGRSVAQLNERLEQHAQALEVCRSDRRFGRAIDALAQSGPNIEQAVQRIAAITSRLAAFAGLDKVERRQADVRDGIRSTLDLMAPHLGDRIEVTAELHDVPKLVCYPSELNQVWMNLLKNAGEALEGTGRIWVRTRLVGDRVCVEIEDDGPGMPPDQLHALFDFRFSRRERVHMGMGLKVAYTIVQKHGGALTAASSGRGTCMTVTLPVAGAPDAGS